MKGNCLPVGACLHYQWIIQQYSPPWCSEYQPCFSPPPPGVFLLLSTAEQRKLRPRGRRTPFFWGTVSGQEGLCSMPWVAALSWSRGTGGRTPTAEGHEHENVHHLLRNYYRLNTLLLLVSSISFSKNMRGDGNLCWKEELQIGWCLSAEWLQTVLEIHPGLALMELEGITWVSGGGEEKELTAHPSGYSGWPLVPSFLPRPTSEPLPLQLWTDDLIRATGLFPLCCPNPHTLPD